MQKRWTEKNVDLNKLAGYAEDFFKDKGFATRKYESMEEHTILWAPPRDKKMSSATKVKIFGNPNDFVIEVTASERSRRSMWLGLLTKSIGGGYLILQDLKLREALEKIEKEFWVFIEDKIANLTGSAGHP
jgi:hypothetical protein